MEGLGCRYFGPQRPGGLFAVTLRINGEDRALPELAAVADLVKHLALPGETLLIEHNGNALRRSEWLDAPLSESDRIELLHIAAGG